MTPDKCSQIEALLGREVLGLSDAERLRLEQHIEHCPGCLADLTLARLVRETIQSASHALTENARTRAIDMAISGAGTLRMPTTTKRRTLFGLAAAASLTVAAAAALLLFAREPRPTPAARRLPAPVATPAEQPAHVEGWLESTGVEQRTFAHASVQLSPTTRVQFDAEQTTLILDHGQVSVRVDVSKGRPFHVRTHNFRVEVLGTQFTVTPDTVQVLHGHLQVFSLTGELLARDLSAGETFSFAAPGDVSAPDKNPASARLWLMRARGALSRGNTKSARGLIERAERAFPHRSELAEAATLRAEAALLERDPKSAVRLYLVVAAQYADLPAGENAAFAAARLAARTEPARERELLKRYLGRYPRGRFAAETRLRLAELGEL